MGGWSFNQVEAIKPGIHWCGVGLGERLPTRAALGLPSLAAGTEGAPPLQGGGLPGEVSLPLRIEMKVEISFSQSNGVLHLVRYV